jgi:hypothetical protein
MYQPQAIYKIEKATGSKSVGLIWSEVLEGRYAIEVHNTGVCRGDLIVFDSQKNFRVLHEEAVDVLYDGKPLDPTDVELWLEIAKGVVQAHK